MRSSGSFRFVWLLVGCLAISSEVLAQDRVVESGQGMDTHLFRPAVDSKGFFTVNGSGVLGANDVSFGLVTDYGHNVMRLAPQHGARALVESSFQGTFHVNYGIADMAIVGLSVPVNLMSGQPATAIGPSGSAYDSGKLDAQNFGNVALHAKLRLSRPEKGIGLALLVQGGLSVSDSMQRNLGADKACYWPQLIVDRHFGSNGRFKIGANIGYRGHTQKNPRYDQLEGGAFEYANLATGGLAVSYRALSSLDLVAETYLTQLLGNHRDSKTALSDEAVVGIKVFVERNSYLLLGGGVRTTNGFQAADQRAFIGFIFEPTIADRDGDGIPDNVDQCPDQPEDLDGYEDDDGCPEFDDDARLLAKRRAGDGDRDGDGILDSIDKCPDDPEDFDGFQDDDGCPDPDNDGDKIPDHLDKCPNEPETYNGFQDDDGCPDQGSIVVEDRSIFLNEKVRFKTNSAEILTESFALLDAMAATLLHHPELVLIEVQGHADERSPEAYNLKLTQDRASAVVQGLVQRGVPRTRLRPMGYGEYCPIDPAHNEQAWETNRRVELKVVETASGLTGVELGCEEARAKGVVSSPAR